MPPQERSYDVVLLDVALGAGPTGYDVARMLRSRRDVVPIIMLTALDSEADAVQGLEAGADDYVTKPFGLAELRSRIRAVLRRAQGRVVEGNLRVGPVMLDRDLRRVTMEDNPVRLTFSEFELLGCLMSRPGYAFNRQELLRADLGRLGLPRPARDRRPHPAPAREARAAPGGAEPDPDRPGSGLPLPGGVIRAALRGLRGRLLLSLVATSAVTLIVAAAITLGPLQSRLRDESETALQQATEDTRYDFGDALAKTAKLRGGRDGSTPATRRRATRWATSPPRPPRPDQRRSRDGHRSHVHRRLRRGARRSCTTPTSRRRLARARSGSRSGRRSRASRRPRSSTTS